MIQERHLELIHADLDGELTPAQRAELAGVLLAQPEARALRADLGCLVGALDRLQSVAPPPGLAPSVLSALAPPRPSRLAPAVNRRWLGSPGLRYAAVFVGGLLASAILLRMAADGGNGPAVSQLVGTIGGPGAAPEQAPVDHAALALADVGGHLNTYRLGAQLVLELDLVALQPVEVVAEHGGQTVRFQLGTPAGVPERLLWLPQSGAGTGSSVAIKVYSEGRLIHQAALEADRRPPE